ncbi:hypothetical protein Tco_0102517, partial [Tanacetum coccineum]
HLASEEIKKIVEEQENIVDDDSILRNDESNIPGTRIEPQSDKESPEVEDEEITDGVYELKRREKGKNVEEIRNSPIPTPIRSPRIHTNLVSSDTEKLQELTDTPHTTSSSSSPHKNYKDEGLILERQKAKEETKRLIAKAILHERRNIQAQISTQIKNAIANVIPSQVDASVRNIRSYMFGHILHVHLAQSKTSSVPDQQYQVYLAMKADPHLQQQDIAIWLAL